jgi:hypothetical protein
MKQHALDRPAGQAIGAPSWPRGWRHPLWLASLVSASVVFSLGLACAVPLVAFAAAAGLSLSRRDAMVLILVVWLANQLVGFTLLDYPWTMSTFAWGAALGIVAILSTMASQWTAKRLAHARRAVSFAATFLIAFTVYESVLFAFSATLLGGAEIYTAAIQGRIFAINAAVFVGLLALNHLAVSVGLTRKPSIVIAMTGQHA